MKHAKESQGSWANFPDWLMLYRPVVIGGPKTLTCLTNRCQPYLVDVGGVPGGKGMTRVDQQWSTFSRRTCYPLLRCRSPCIHLHPTPALHSPVASFD